MTVEVCPRHTFKKSHYFCTSIWWRYNNEKVYFQLYFFSLTVLSLCTWVWCVCICASTYECHQNELQWCPGRCSGVPAAPSSLAWCQVSRVSRCLGGKPVWSINLHYIPKKGWPGQMWGTAETAHPKRANDDSLLYTSSVQWMYDQETNKSPSLLMQTSTMFLLLCLSWLSLSQLCTTAWQRRIHKLRISKTAWICCCSVAHCGRARDSYICLHPSFSGSFSLYPHPLFIPSSSHQPLRTHTHIFERNLPHILIFTYSNHSCTVTMTFRITAKL